ncbi:MAG: hypothetical protein ACI9D0_001355 [Bacteroidia bacterium]|jgi:hypothetical protein
MSLPKVLLASLLATSSLLAFGATSEAVPSQPNAVIASSFDDLDEAIDELKKKGTLAEIEDVKKVAVFKNRKALDALLELYGQTPSAYIKRSILVVLPNYDRVEGCDADALQLLMSEAVGNKMLELRKAALEGLTGCSDHGAPYLRMIVDSEAEDEIRFESLEAHVGMRQADDDFWYKRIFKYGMGAEPAEKKKKKDDEERGPSPLNGLRTIAFDAIAGSLEIKELQIAAEDPLGSIRIRAVQELYSRGEKKIEKRAAEVFDDNNERWQNRAAAAKILLDLEGAKFAKIAIKEVTKSITPGALRMNVAELLAGASNDEDIAKLIVKGFGKGKSPGKLFHLRAAANLDDEKLEKPTVKMFKDKDREVVEAAVDFAIAHNYEEVEEAVQTLFDDAETNLERSILLSALGKFKGGDAWRSQLKGYVDAGEQEMRNTALVMLSEYGKSQLPVIVAALDHELWSTRLVALKCIEKMGIGSAVGEVIGRMETQTGRMKVEFGASLFRMTGELFGSRYQPWKAWWEDKGGDGYKMITESKLKLKIEEREIRKLKELTSARFFGIQIDSNRVVFIIDVSGSMSELTRGEYIGAKGEPRINLATRELNKCLDQLSQESFFNIVPFSSDVAPYSKELVQWTPEALVDAKGFVSKLGAGGGTNLFGSLESVFQDPQVDTIFILSDGEPSVGRIQDPSGIRTEVAKWNKHREVKIHSIAVGGSLQVLQWLAEDSGGTYVRFP